MRLFPCFVAPLAAGFVVALAGCALKKPPDAASIQEEALPAVNIPAQWIAPAGAGAVIDDWLVAFRDSHLVAAVNEAIANNPDLRVGAARVEEAQLYARLAGAKLYPSVDLLARGGGKMSGDGSGLRGAAVTATWEVDLWGRVRYGRAAAVEDAVAARTDFAYARQSIAASVAKNWFLATEAGLQANLARESVRQTQALVRLAESRSHVGIGNDEDVYVSRASLGTYRDTLREIELARDDALRGLELLMGAYPAAAVNVGVELPAQPDAVPAGLPSELLERRPDVVAAERRVAAAFNRIHEAKAARLPTISLTTGVSKISSQLFLLQGASNPVWNVGALLLAPLYKGGALKTQVDIRTAEQKQAIAAYAAIGLRAFGEVEKALAAEIGARDREQILLQALSDQQRALDILLARFKVGSTDLRFVTQQQLTRTAAQSALIRVRTEQRVQRVNLHLALGGNFDVPSSP